MKMMKKHLTLKVQIQIMLPQKQQKKLMKKSLMQKVILTKIVLMV